MTLYSQQELVSSTVLSKQFGEYLSKIKNGILDKIAIMKNNKINAVIISTENYEKMISEINEARENGFLKEVQKRSNDSKDKFIDGQTVLNKYNLKL